MVQKMGVLFAGKMPHVAALVPGGVTEKVTAHKASFPFYRKGEAPEKREA